MSSPLAEQAPPQQVLAENLPSEDTKSETRAEESNEKKRRYDDEDHNNDRRKRSRYDNDRDDRRGDYRNNYHSHRSRDYSPERRYRDEDRRRDSRRNDNYRRKEHDSEKLSSREAERERQRREREELSEKGRATAKPKKPVEEQSPAQLMEKFKNSGVYIPPFKLRKIKQTVTDKKSDEFQRLSWEALRKSINGIVNKVNITNIKNIISELFSENLVRGRGLFTRSIMKAQAASPNHFTHVYAALIAVINTRMPEIGDLVLKRLIISFRKSYKRNDKPKCIASALFIAHLVNQQVASEVLAGQILGLLLERPTDDSVEMAVAFLKACGAALHAMAPKILHAVFERLRSVLHEGAIDKRVQYMIEALFAIRKTEFRDFPAVLPELDLVEQNDQAVHDLELDDETLDPEDRLDYYSFDAEYEQNEEIYSSIKKAILGDDEEEEEVSEDEEEEASTVMEQVSENKSEAESVEFKRVIYLTIMSSMSHEETVHKLIKSGLVQPGKEMELSSMIIECCAQERTYLRYYGLVASNLCKSQKNLQDSFNECFRLQYSTIHRLETNRLRNVARLFAHLFYTDAISWSVMEIIHLNAQETTSASRIFIKILFQELCEMLGLAKLTERLLKDEYLKESFAGMFPTDNAKNTRFAINFWTSVGLGPLTDELREYLKTAPKRVVEEDSDSSSSDSSDSDSSDSDSSSDSD
jgi:pre-mRNA-splicing factor CWC22